MINKNYLQQYILSIRYSNKYLVVSIKSNVNKVLLSYLIKKKRELYLNNNKLIFFLTKIGINKIFINRESTSYLKKYFKKNI